MTWIVCCDHCEVVKESGDDVPYGWRESDNGKKHYCAQCYTKLGMTKPRNHSRLVDGNRIRHERKSLDNRLVIGADKAMGKHDALATG